MMRYLPLTEADRRDMLTTIGAPSIAALFEDEDANVRVLDSKQFQHPLPQEVTLAWNRLGARDS